MLDFRVEVGAGQRCATVTVFGELDIATAPELVAAIDEARATPAGSIVVDLLATSFIDSTGLTTLFRAHKRFEQESRDFSIVVGPDNVEVQRVIDLMGFDDVFTLHESRASAGCEDNGGGPSS